MIKTAYYWWCECECGNGIRIRGDHLRNGAIQSCGCLQKERASKAQTTHGHTRRGEKTAEYKAWTEMLKRCYNPKNQAYERYGGRGITVFDPWRTDFEAFLMHIKNKPNDGKEYSIDRIDNDKGYFPGNVKWSTCVEQCRNRRSNRLETIDGITMCHAAWCEKYRISQGTMFARLKLGWTFEDALMKPVKHIKKTMPPDGA